MQESAPLTSDKQGQPSAEKQCEACGHALGSAACRSTVGGASDMPGALQERPTAGEDTVKRNREELRRQLREQVRADLAALERAKSSLEEERR